MRKDKRKAQTKHHRRRYERNRRFPRGALWNQRRWFRPTRLRNAGNGYWRDESSRKGVGRKGGRWRGGEAIEEVEGGEAIAEVKEIEVVEAIAEAEDAVAAKKKKTLTTAV